MTEDQTTRRQWLTRTAAAGGVVWVTPSVFQRVAAVGQESDGGTPPPTVETQRIAYSLSISSDTNIPTFELTNTSEFAQITDFNFTIGNTAKHFDQVLHSVIPSGGTATVNNPDTVQEGDRTNDIDIDYTGFDPSELHRFTADVDSDLFPFNTVENYQTVFWNNGAGTPNSVITVTFSTGDALQQTVPETPSGPPYVFTDSASVPL